MMHREMTGTLSAGDVSALDGVPCDSRVLQALIDNLPSGVSFFGRNLEMIAYNARFRSMLDFPDHLFADGLPSLVTLARFNARRGEYGPGDPEALAHAMIDRYREMRPHVFERTRPDGTVLEVRATPLAAGGIVTTYTDITERRRAEQEVRRARDLMTEAINASAAFVWELDADGRYTYVHGAEKILGWRDADMVGQPAAAFHAPATAGCPEGDATLAAMADGVPFKNATICLKRRAGGRVYVSSSGHPITDADGRFIGHRGVDVDVTELTEVRMELERMALHDPLTGLANRHKFLDRFTLECERQRRYGRPLSLLVIDVDHFKRVNDRHGHLAGDAVLRHVAEVLRATVRGTDLVARFGGEEFIVLLPETDETGARNLAETLRRRIAAEPARTEAAGAPVRQALTISVGVATAVPGEQRPPSFDDLMERADAAVYRAKNAGRDRVVHAADAPAA